MALPVSAPPSTLDVFRDRTFRGLTFAFAWLTVLLMFYILWEIGGEAVPAIQKYGLSFITSATWDANRAQFGILPEIWGLCTVRCWPCFLGGFFGVTIAIFLTQDFLPYQIEVVFKNIIELLAAIPSVVYGLWGIFVLIPAIRPMANWLHEYFGWLLSLVPRWSGPGLLPAALVLTIMVLPTISAISRDALGTVHPRIEAAVGLGATRWEAILRVILPTASTGIFGALVLGFGRAGRNHGPGHAGRQLKPVEPIALLASQYPGRLAGAQFSGSRQGRDPGAHVRQSCSWRSPCWSTSAARSSSITQRSDKREERSETRQSERRQTTQAGTVIP